MGNAWESIKDGGPDGKYERKITSNFANDNDDIFMRSMITKYAHEQRTPIEELEDGSKIGGEPTGAFMMAKKDMFRASKEVMGTHKGLKGADLDSYLERCWSNFDVNGDGVLAVIKSPMFMRFLASDQGLFVLSRLHVCLGCTYLGQELWWPYTLVATSLQIPRRQSSAPWHQQEPPSYAFWHMPHAPH